MANAYAKGQLVKVTAAFTDTNDAYTDPTGVSFSFIAPGAEAVSYAYGTDAELIKDATGRYHVDLDADTVGVWHYRWASTGDSQAAAESFFIVNPTQF